MMRQNLSSGTADRLILYAFLAWGASIVHPGIGFLMQFPAIIYLACKCDLKALPALLILLLSRSNFTAARVDGVMALRLGITLTGDSCLCITVFFIALKNLLTGRFGQGFLIRGLVWLLAFIPAAVIAFQAKGYGLSGSWSGPIMDAISPALYFWGILLGRTYESSQKYLSSRLFFVLFVIGTLLMLRVATLFSFGVPAMLICTSVYILFKDTRRQSLFMKFMASIAIVLALMIILFLRRMALEAAYEADITSKEMLDADKIGGTFTSMATVLCACGGAFLFSHGIGRSCYRIFPVLLVVINILFVTYVVATQSGNQKKDTTSEYQTIGERFQHKLFADRAAVWMQGWDEIRQRPLVFTDLRKFHYVRADGQQGIYVPPHNQFLTLLGRRGWWLGLYLSIFIIVIWSQALGVVAYKWKDPFISIVLIPSGFAIFFIVGITGQSVLSQSLWGDALLTLVFPGIVFGIRNFSRGILSR